jgi:hypothetical protein
MRDREAGLVMGILCTLHACFEAVDLDDAVLRLSVSLKLALLLEEPSQQARVCVRVRLCMCVLISCGYALRLQT